MPAKNGTNGHDLIGDSVEQVLRLYDQIKQAQDVVREAVEVPEWGCTVWVRTLSGDDRDEFETWAARRRQEATERGEEPNARGIRARVAMLTVTDADGNRLFGESDIEWLGKKSGAALDRIFTVADRLSGLSGGAQAAIRGNSPATPGVAGPTA